MAALLAVVLLTSGTSLTSAEPIPHEKFDQAQLDLAVLKLLLNESLRLATESIMACVDEDPSSAAVFSSRMGESLAAPSAIISELSEDVESYGYLVTFIPPFQDMAYEDSLVTSAFGRYWENLTELRSIVSHMPLTPEEGAHGLEILASVNAHVYELYSLLDELEGAAEAIDALPEIEGQGDLDVQPLLDAIDALRNKLRLVEEELEIISEHFADTTPRLVLVANDDNLYLGESLILTGYMFVSGRFVPDLDISVLRDGLLFREVNTGTSGRYSVIYVIPVEEDELGTFVYGSNAVYNGTVYYSANLTIVVDRIPTTVTLDPQDMYKHGADITAPGTLSDYRGRAVAGVFVRVYVDAAFASFLTSREGAFLAAFNSSSMSVGEHTMRATYLGNATLAPSTTQTFSFLLKYPAILTLALSSTALKHDEDLRLTGMFTNTSGTPIADASIGIVLDGTMLLVLSTNATGQFTAVLRAEDIGSGTHVMYAEHNGTGTVWFPTRSPDVSFTISPEQGGGIFPGIVEPEDIIHFIEELLFGEYALFFWSILIIIIVAAYLLYRRHKENVRRRAEQLSKALIYEPQIVFPKVRPLATEKQGFAKKLAESTLARFIDNLLGSMDPRNAIILGYNRFLHFLGSEMEEPMEPSLTHLEIQDELVFIGYPKETVGRVTRTYEKAMFTVREVTVEDALGFADALADLEGYGKVMPS